MACDHGFRPTQDGNRICRRCGISTSHVSFRVPNRFARKPATTLDVTGISIAVFFGSLLTASAGLAAICARQLGWL